MFQLGWAAVTRYLVKRYSRCFCESLCWMRLTFKCVDFKPINLPRVSQPHPFLEALLEQRLTSFEPEGILPADCVWSWMTALPQVFSWLAYPADVKFIMPLQSHEPIKKKTLSLYIYVCIHILLVFFLWRPWLTQERMSEWGSETILSRLFETGRLCWCRGEDLLFS